MKKAISIVLVLVIIVGLAACTPKEEKWRTFLKEYEQWADEYIALVQKYKSNPLDMSILSDYTKMVSEMTDWTSKANDIKAELKDSDALAEFTQELLRISTKIASAALQ